MSLVSCPDCENQVSDIAPSCPKCGRPMAPQVTERTAKKWKAKAGLGSLITGGGVLMILSSALLVSSRTGLSISEILMWGGVVLIGVGIPIVMYATAGAWWHHD